MSRRVIFIGAAGEMCRLAVERFAKAEGDWELVLCDIRPELLDPLVRKLPTGLATAQKLDLYDRKNLMDVIKGATLVVLGAGPYIRTSEPVIEACLEAKVPYLDFDDDNESTQHALGLDKKAKKAGIPIYVGCGASPGMSNVMVEDAISELDTVENIDIGWLVGDERPTIGRAVIEHLLHISAGDCLTWENGGQVVHETFVETDVFPMGGSLGDTLMYETAHPEAVTFPRRYPQAQRIRVLGGLDPSPFNGVARGIGLAVQEGKMTSKEGVDFIVDIVEGKIGSGTGWRYAMAGMLAQVRRGESKLGTLLKFLGSSALRQTYAYRAGLFARVYGTRDGKPAISIRRTTFSGNDSYLFRDMAAVTGTSCAAFMVLALEASEKQTGAFAPEDWADPQAFYSALERVGVPRRELPESISAFR